MLADRSSCVGALVLGVGLVATAACSGAGHRSRGAAVRRPTAPPAATSPTPPSTIPSPLPTEPALPPAPPPEPVVLGTESLAAKVYRVPTSQPVVFVTIDDGWVRDPRIVGLVQSDHLAPTLFLVGAAAAEDAGYFRALAGAGASIEDHTLTHPYLNRLSLSAQEHQICGAADQELRLFGVRATLLRPPYGAMNTMTRRAARTCRLRAVVEWTATMDAGHLTVRGGRLQAGDIVLLHFRPTLYADLTALVERIRQAGLTVAHLEDYLQV